MSGGRERERERERAIIRRVVGLGWLANRLYLGIIMPRQNGLGCLDDNELSLGDDARDERRSASIEKSVLHLVQKIKLRMAQRMSSCWRRLVIRQRSPIDDYRGSVSSARAESLKGAVIRSFVFNFLRQ
jgi:hypothetical protein